MFNNCFCLFLDNIPRQKAIHTRQAQSQVKVESSREPPGRFNSENALGLGLWRSTNTLLLPLVVATLLIFTVLQAVVFKATVELGGGGGMQIVQIKILQSALSLPKSSLFFLVQTLPELLQHFDEFSEFWQSYPDTFCKCSCCFYGKREFSEVLTPPLHWHSK